MTSKNDIFTSILTFFVRTSVALLLCRFRPVLLLLQTTQAREKPRQAMVRSVVWCQSNSDQFLVPGRVEYGGLVSLFLSVLMLLHCSGQIPETAALYTYTPNIRRGEFTPRESEVKTEQTPVVYGYPGPLLI
jgi:hypothetical protein